VCVCGGEGCGIFLRFFLQNFHQVIVRRPPEREGTYSMYTHTHTYILSCFCYNRVVFLLVFMFVCVFFLVCVCFTLNVCVCGGKSAAFVFSPSDCFMDLRVVLLPALRVLCTSFCMPFPSATSRSALWVFFLFFLSTLFIC
jgi:hypothetical protein